MEQLLIERAKRRMSIQELAARSGLNEHTISDIERGIRKPRATTIAKLAGALELSPEELLGKAPAPSRSGQPSAGEDGTEDAVRCEVALQRIAAAGAVAGDVAKVWQEELRQSLKEDRPLGKYRILEMCSLHNELSRLYVGYLKSLIEGAKLGTFGLNIEGTNQYLSPNPERWPRELKEPLYEAGARISALAELAKRIELKAAEQHKAASERALYEEFNVEDHLSSGVTQDPEWKEAISKVLAEVEA